MLYNSILGIRDKGRLTEALFSKSVQLAFYPNFYFSASQSVGVDFLFIEKRYRQVKTKKKR